MNGTSSSVQPKASRTVSSVLFAGVPLVNAQAVHRVGELAERNPNETASIVRQWLSEQQPA